MNLLRIAGNTAFGVAAVTGLGVAERVGDPFDRHAHSYTIEGPKGASEVFYASVNRYDERGQKHDDRFGDGLMATSALALVIGIGFRLRDEPDSTSRPAESANA